MVNCHDKCERKRVRHPSCAFLQGSTSHASSKPKPTSGPAARRRVQDVVLALGLLFSLSACSVHPDKPSCNDHFDFGETGQYLRNELGVVLDARTGNTWFACNAGQRFYAGRCLGDPARLNWEEANRFASDFAVLSGGSWRLPTSNEMQSLVERRCVNPAVNPQVFPGIQSSNYWTSSPTWWGAQFACALNTTNGRLFCRNSRQIQMPFMLIRD